MDKKDCHYAGELKTISGELPAGMFNCSENRSPRDEIIPKGETPSSHLLRREFADEQDSIVMDPLLIRSGKNDGINIESTGAHTNHSRGRNQLSATFYKEDIMAKNPSRRKTQANSSATKSAQYGEQTVTVGAGGETHQIADDGAPVLTTQQGTPVSDDQNSLKIGARGPTVLEDFHFREKIFHFDHERIPERVVHARGFGAHGYFENYQSLAELTKADLFQRAGEKTPAFVRFSTVAGNKGSADLARDVRGFAVKLYTQQGNWDIVGNNIPVFFIQDALKFPDFVHSVKEEPDRGFPQAASAHDNFWDFVSLSPESTHMLFWAMSDRAIPRSFRFMEGFGVHTFRLVNADGKSTFVKFHWKPKLGLQSVVWNEAVKINGADPDFHRRDLWNSIKAGDYPEWELGLQLFDEDFAEQFDFDVLDADQTNSGRTSADPARRPARA